MGPDKRDCEPPLDHEFHDFFGRWMPVLSGYLAHTFGDYHAEDVAIEAMVAAQVRWDVLRKYDKPEAWLFKVAQRMMVRAVSRDGRAAGGSVVDDLAVSDSSEGQIQKIDIEEAIRLLPCREAQAVWLHYIAGFDIASTASVMGLAAGTVKRNLFDARLRLKETLDGYGAAGRGRYDLP